MSVKSLLGMFMLPHIDLLRVGGRAADSLAKLKPADMEWMSQGKFALVEATEQSDSLPAAFLKRTEWRYMGKWMRYKVLKSSRLESS